MKLIDQCVVDNWTALNAATENVGLEAGGECGRSVLTFDKKSDAAITSAGAYKTLTTKQAIHAGGGSPQNQYVCWVLKASALTNIASATLRLGTSASHYNEWTVADTALTAGGCVCQVRRGNCTRTGNGCNYSEITYVAVTVNFDAQANTLANMQVERIEIMEASEL